METLRNLCSYLTISRRNAAQRNNRPPAYGGCSPGMASFRSRCRREKARHSLAARQAAFLKPATRGRSPARGVSASRPIKCPRNKTPQTESRDSLSTVAPFSHSAAWKPAVCLVGASRIGEWMGAEPQLSIPSSTSSRLFSAAISAIPHCFFGFTIPSLSFLPGL